MLPTPLTHKIEHYIREKITAYGLPPTRREILHDCGVSSTSVVTNHLNHLAKTGIIIVDQEIARGIRLVEPVHEYITTIDEGIPVPTLAINSLKARIERIANGRSGTVYFKADAPKREAETP
jgi:SOS-response transcriptional repressor LexA